MISRIAFFVTASSLLLSLLAFPVLAAEAPPPASPAPPSSPPPARISAQLDFTPAFTIYMPLISRAKPTNSMAQVVLQPDEVPAGFILDSAGVITDFTQFLQLNPVEGYQAFYSNFAQLFSGTFFITSLAIRFQVPQGAQGYIQFVTRNLMNQPDATVVELPVPALGEETIAYQTVNLDGGIPLVLNIVMLRKGNIIAAVVTGGFFPVASDPTLVMSLAGIISAKF